MSLHTKQQGFSAFELVLVLAVVAILGLAGYQVYSRHNAQTATTNSSVTTASQNSTSSNVSNAPVISSTSDLDKSVQILDQNDPATANNIDSSQLDNQSSAF
jgi:prepilin-type N-terminal cleavage/methylation domain-containing protein